MAWPLTDQSTAFRNAIQEILAEGTAVDGLGQQTLDRPTTIRSKSRAHFNHAVEFRGSAIKAGGWLTRQRIKNRLLRAQAFPSFKVLQPCLPHPLWTLFFVFLPDGQIKPAQRETIKRLKRLGRPLLVVCAAADAAEVPKDLRESSDALIWKELSGWDFSGYKIGLDEVARNSSGADVFVLNDSVYGPLFDISQLIDRPLWDLTGFTGSYQFEEHIQSYAFILRDVTTMRIKQLRDALPGTYSYDSGRPVVLNLETRLARIASKNMSVGMMWLPESQESDPTIANATDLISDGFPFLKKNLFNVHCGCHDPERLKRLLALAGIPI